ncbi:MAG: BolA/IbaG family iron-sulfur metabolism protein [Pseudomonadota bacterium]
MTMQERLAERLETHFAPTHLDVIDESHQHNVPAGAESHFKVTLVCAQFEAQPLIKRHRAVHQALADGIQDAIHALALHTYTPEEWQAKGGEAPASPPCRGGGRADN